MASVFQGCTYNSVTYTAIIAYCFSLPPHLRFFQKIGDFPSALQFLVISKCNDEAFAMAEVCVHVCVRVFYVCLCDMVAIPVQFLLKLLQHKISSYS